MKTIIELYDEEPIFNILAAVAFSPGDLGVYRRKADANGSEKIG